MDLRGKLARLGSAGPGSAPAPSGPTLLPPDDRSAERRSRVDRLRALVGEVVARQKRREQTLVEARREATEGELPGELRETAHGSVHVVERFLEPTHCHGRTPVAGALDVDPSVLARLALDPALEAVDPRGALLLDTETTGLSGGTGTLAFLVGMAWFEDQSLCVQQLLLRRPGEEGPMLRVLAERMARSSCIVTYNGKAFDWPLLRTRFVMNRIPVPCVPPHVDLLHCARRVLRPRLDGLRLVNLESEVLGMVREDDVDGSLIPRLYLGFLRGAGGAGLVPVIEHNAHDLVALAAVMGRLCAHFEDVRMDDDPRDHLAYARVAERAGDADRATRFAIAAAGGGAAVEVTVEAWLLVARLARRRGDVDAEEHALVAALEAAGRSPAAADVHLALAKMLEHRRRDLERALSHARRTIPAETEDERDHRVARLERRVARSRDLDSPS